MFNLRRKKRLTTLAIVFALLLVTSVVYALGVGALNFQGNVSLAPVGELIIVVTEGESGTDLLNSSYGTMTVSTDGKTATISGRLMGAGESLEFEFYVENTGTVDYEIINVDEVITPPVGLVGSNPFALGGDFSDLEGEIIDVGSTSFPPSLLTVEWTDGVNDSAEGDFEFTITLDYDPAP